MKNYRIIVSKLHKDEKERFINCVNALKPVGLYRDSVSVVLRSLMIYFIYNGNKILPELLSIDLSSLTEDNATTISSRVKLPDFEQFSYYVKRIREDYKLQGRNINKSCILRKLIIAYTRNPVKWEELLKDLN